MNAPSGFPEWIEPMAATLTQERFTGPEWTFERKLDGIRLVAFKQGDDVRLYSRTRQPKTLPPVAAAVAALPVRDVILDGELTWESRRRRVPRLRRRLARRARHLARFRCTERRALLDALPLQPPLRARAAARRRRAVDARARRRMGGRDREAARLAVRAEAIEALAQDEMRDCAGLRRRRLHRSAGRAHRARRAARGLLRRRTTSSSPARSERASTRHCSTSLRSQLDALEIETTPFTKATGLPRVREHWVRPEIVVHVAFIEWTVHGKLRHSRLLAVVTGRRARDVVREARGS